MLCDAGLGAQPYVLYYCLLLLKVLLNYYIPLLHKHLFETNHLPLAGVGVQRKVGVLNLAIFDGSRLNLAAGNRTLKMVCISFHREIGEGQIPSVARSNRRRSCVMRLEISKPSTISKGMKPAVP